MKIEQRMIGLFSEPLGRVLAFLLCVAFAACPLGAAQGAALGVAEVTVSWDETRPSDDSSLKLERWRLFLQPLEVSSSVGMETLGRALNSDVLVWKELPAGRYRLLLKPRAGEVLRSPATWELAKIDLAAGDKRSLSLVLPEAMSQALRPEPPQGADLKVRFLASDEPVASLEGLEILRVEANGAWRVAAELPVEGGMLTIPKGCVGAATYHFSTASQVSEAVSLAGRNCEASPEITVNLLPAATVAGILVSDHGLPTFGSASVLPCEADLPNGDGGAGEEIRRYPVLPKESGSFTLKLPIGCARLFFFFPPLAGEAPGRLSLVAEKQTELGRLLLRRGGGVTGRILNDDTLAPSSGVAVSLFRLEDLGPEEKQALSKIPLHQSQKLGAGGWFRFIGLQEGLYYLRLRPKSRYRSVTFFGPVEVAAGDDLVVDDLLLPRAANLTLRVSPGEILRPEDYELTLISSFQPNCGLPPQTMAGFPSKLKTEKDFAVEDLPPGQYSLWVQALGPFGGAFGAAQIRVDLESGEATEAVLEMRGNLFKGQVLRAGEPARAKLDFYLGGDRRREDQFGIPSVYADQEGKFEVMLPGPGTYRVRAKLSATQHLMMPLGEIDFLSQDEVVEVNIPAAAVGGRVVDGRGQRLKGWSGVMATLEDSSELEVAHRLEDPVKTMVEANREGEFVLRGLAPGTWRLIGTGGGEPMMRSQPFLISLGEDEQRDGVVLVVEASEEVEGRVVTDGQVPVPGASFQIRIPWSSGGIDRPLVQGQAGADGTFEFAKIEGTRAEGTLRLLAPGFPVVLRKVRIESPMEISIPRSGGTFRLQRNQALLGEESEVLFLVAEDGSAIGLHELSQARNGSGFVAGTDQVFGPVAPGVWRLVRVTGEQRADVALALASGASLFGLPGQSFEILPGGHQDLMLSP